MLHFPCVLRSLGCWRGADQGNRQLVPPPLSWPEPCFQPLLPLHSLFTASTRKPEAGSRARWTETLFFLPCCEKGQRHKECGDSLSCTAVSKWQTVWILRFRRRTERAGWASALWGRPVRDRRLHSEHELAFRPRPGSRVAADAEGLGKACGGDSWPSPLQTVCLG